MYQFQNITHQRKNADKSDISLIFNIDAVNFTELFHVITGMKIVMRFSHDSPSKLVKYTFFMTTNWNFLQTLWYVTSIAQTFHRTRSLLNMHVRILVFSDSSLKERLYVCIYNWYENSDAFTSWLTFKIGNIDVFLWQQIGIFYKLCGT